jgi:hypothetical protein
MMGKVILGLLMSLDGFINDSMERLYSDFVCLNRHKVHSPAD